MKIIITESQELDIKKKIIFMLLNNMNYNLIEINNNIYFVKKIGDEKGDIRFNKSNGACLISHKFISFLSTMTGFLRHEVIELIGNWVEHTLQMEVKSNPLKKAQLDSWLNIPYN
jgi:hypothetical protein